MTYFPLRQTTCFFIPLVAPCKPLLISNDTKIKIETSQGTLIAKLCDDPNYPGIWLEIDRPEFGNSVAVAKLEVYEDSGRMILDVYSDALQDEVTEQIPIENLDRWEEGNE